MKRYRVLTRYDDADGDPQAMNLTMSAGSPQDAMRKIEQHLSCMGAEVRSFGEWSVLGPAPPPIGTFYERKLTDKARVFVNTVGGPGPGGAHVTYHLFGNSKDRESFCKAIVFQCGNPDEGINGITNEQLLAIVRHRLQGFQSGPFPCEENAEAGKYVDAALKALERRANERLDRGVSGEQVP